MTTIDQLKQEIIDWASDHDNIDVPDFTEAFSEFIAILSWRRAEIHLPSGVASLVERFGGQGLGDDARAVFTVNDQYFRVDGEWDDGFHWDADDIYEATPVNVTVVEYHEKEL
jgi:hypothetical protein